MHKIYKIALYSIVVCASHMVYAQCPVVATASSNNITCGDPVTLNAIPAGCKPLNNDFNGGTIGTWQSTSGGVISDGSTTPNASYSCMGASPDPPYYFFMGSTSNTPRALTSNALDLTACPNNGGSACWYMKFSTQGQSGTCEGPDAGGEGVYLEYSTNGGGTWTQIGYWDPNGGNDPNRINWKQYCTALPAAAITAATNFRWIQKACSGVGYDTWAIDKVQIILNTIGYTFDWGHDAQAPAATPSTPAVTPTVNTTYTVTYTNSAAGGTDNCTSSVVVNVTTPQTTATGGGSICPGGSLVVQANAPCQVASPTSCGLSVPAQYCDPVCSISNDYQIGNGAIVNGFNGGTGSGACGGPSGVVIFGDFGDDNARTQILYRLADLVGMKAGKITNISFELAHVNSNGNPCTPVASLLYDHFQIQIACVPTTTNVVNSSSPFLAPAFSTVYNDKATTLITGWNQFNFDNYYDWDGTTNLLVQICWYENVNNTERLGFTRDNNAGYSCLARAVTNASPNNTVCSATTFYTTSNNRPNTKFGNCQPIFQTMSYNWTPSAGLSSTTARNPTASPTTSTTYTVSGYINPNPQCATTATVAVDVNNVTASVTPTYAYVCPASGTPSIALTASGAASGNYSGAVTFTNSTAATIVNNTPAGVNSTMSVQGISPDATSQLTKVCLNVTETRDQDLKVTLQSPGGSVIRLLNNGGGQTGGNLTNTCFITGGAALTAAPYTGNFAPNQAYAGLSGVANGNWTLNVSDNNATGANGTLTNWTMTFNTTANGIVGYQWSPATGLSSTTSPTPTATPTANTTYTVKVTDALGCTANTNVVVSYCPTLPVNMLSFDGVKEGSAVKLKWETAQEENNAFFYIDRSKDGLTFENIGSQLGKGNTNVKSNYSFIDTKPALGLNYYRLRQADYNGKAQVSEIITVFFSNGAANFILNNLQPIPAGDVLNYNINIANTDQLQVQVLDMSGKVLKSENAKVQAGLNTMSVNVSNLAEGVYFLKITGSNSAAAVQRFTK